MQMVAHGLTAGLLFMVVGLLYQRTHTRDLADYGALSGVAPRFAFFVAFALLAAIGLPGSAGFIAELHVLVGGFGQWGGWMLIVCLGALIGAAYGLRVMTTIGSSGKKMAVVDMTRTELTAAVVLALAILWLGLWPSPLLELVSGNVAEFGKLMGGLNAR